MNFSEGTTYATTWCQIPTPEVLRSYRIANYLVYDRYKLFGCKNGVFKQIDIQH